MGKAGKGTGSFGKEIKTAKDFKMERRQKKNENAHAV